MKGEPFETDLPMPKFDRIAACTGDQDIKRKKIAVYLHPVELFPVEAGSY